MLEELDIECLQVEGIVVSGDGDGDVELLEAAEEGAGFECGGVDELGSGDDLSDGHAFDETCGGVVVIGVGV